MSLLKLLYISDISIATPGFVSERVNSATSRVPNRMVYIFVSTL